MAGVQEQAEAGFRPTLEDFIEFIWMERLVRTMHPGWKQVLAEHRATWRNLQLKSAVRADPEVAIEQLRAMGYVVSTVG